MVSQVYRRQVVRWAAPGCLGNLIPGGVFLQKFGKGERKDAGSAERKFQTAEDDLHTTLGHSVPVGLALCHVLRCRD